MHLLPPLIPTSISPSLARIFVLAVALAVAPSLSGAENIGESDVTRLAKQHNPTAGQLSQAIALQKANRSTASLRSNPRIAWQREHLTSSSDAEDILSITVPLNRTRQQSVRQSLAKINIAEAKGAAIIGNADAVRRALELFYGCIAQEQRITIEELAWQRLVEASRVVSRRREEGHLSGYELARVELESELAQSRVEEARTLLASMKSELAPLLGLKVHELTLVGTLSPNARALETSPKTSASLLALRSATEFAEAAKNQASRTWIPTVSATAGAKFAYTQEVDYGYVAGLSLNLPVWTGSTALKQRTKAKAGQVTAQLNALTTERRIRGAAALQTLQGLRAEATRFESATKNHVAALTLAAESGYREGQRTLVELLDATKTLSSVRTRRLALQLAVKQAELAVRDSRGEFE